MTSRVSLVRAEGYDNLALRSSLTRLIEQLGGWGRFVKRGEKILLKPNLLSARIPDKGVTTHPAVVKAVAESLLDLGATVAIGDSPGGADKGVERVFRNTGMLSVAEELGIEWVNFEASGAKKIQTEGGITLHIARAIEHYDHIISISKLKTHNLVVFTGAVKNLFGLVPGFQKTAYHKLYPLPTEFGRLLVAIYEYAPVTLHIMDAIVGMEGNGPASGDLRDVGLLLASPDGVALDRTIEHIVGIKDGKTITTGLASERGAGVGRLDDIEILGGELSEFVIEQPFKTPFKLPEMLVPSLLVRIFAPLIWIRPAPIEEKCARCGICANHCPTDCITIHGDELPVFDYDKCITCLCCNELCPEDAITLERSWLARKLGR